MMEHTTIHSIVAITLQVPRAVKSIIQARVMLLLKAAILPALTVDAPLMVGLMIPIQLMLRRLALELKAVSSVEVFMVVQPITQRVVPVK